MNSKTTRNINILLWFIMSVALLVLEYNNQLFNIFLITILGGIIGLIGIGLIYNNFKGWIVFDVSLAILSYPISRIIGVRGINIKEIVIFLGILIVMQLFLDDFIRNKKNKKRCTVPFEAKCVSFAQSGVSTYIPIYRYHVNGKSNMFYGNNLSSVNPKLGEIITVFVNKKNENDVYCPTAKAILMLRYIIRFFYN